MMNTIRFILIGFILIELRAQDFAPCKGKDDCCDGILCGINEGDCDSHENCAGHLRCGVDNCIGNSFDPTDDCCWEDPLFIPQQSEGPEMCEIAQGLYKKHLQAAIAQGCDIPKDRQYQQMKNLMTVDTTTTSIWLTGFDSLSMDDCSQLSCSVEFIGKSFTCNNQNKDKICKELLTLLDIIGNTQCKTMLRSNALFEEFSKAHSELDLTWQGLDRWLHDCEILNLPLRLEHFRVGLGLEALNTLKTYLMCPSQSMIEYEVTMLRWREEIFRLQDALDSNIPTQGQIYQILQKTYSKTDIIQMYMAMKIDLDDARQNLEKEVVMESNHRVGTLNKIYCNYNKQDWDICCFNGQLGTNGGFIWPFEAITTEYGPFTAIFEPELNSAPADTVSYVCVEETQASEIDLLSQSIQPQPPTPTVQFHSVPVQDIAPLPGRQICKGCADAWQNYCHAATFNMIGNGLTMGKTLPPYCSDEILSIIYWNLITYTHDNVDHFNALVAQAQAQAQAGEGNFDVLLAGAGDEAAAKANAFKEKHPHGIYCKTETNGNLLGLIDSCQHHDCIKYNFESGQWVKSNELCLSTCTQSDGCFRDVCIYEYKIEIDGVMSPGERCFEHFCNNPYSDHCMRFCSHGANEHKNELFCNSDRFTNFCAQCAKCTLENGCTPQNDCHLCIELNK